MRKLLSIVAIGVAVWWFITRRGTSSPDGATIGYEDGSSVTLHAGSPELDRLLAIAAEVAAP
jgi:hypothetical protein